MTPFLNAAVQHLGTNEFTVINGEEIEFPDGSKVSSDDLDAIKALASIIEEEPDVPDRVTARQFKLQLLTDGLLDQVEAWISTQERAVQIAFEYSGTFVRDEPMMQAGFSALDFNEAQIDAFFTSAAEL
ncbi:hypothetical protein C7441_114133 [Pseudaminobacter salicylatoxidans]|uniref:Uncharacterized protein n=1 Tax=Pseudaminobacter salicylatoxidans TaxID=93369 RepID=A0A316C3H4_PSESE|nr:hypothetical protein [Pseudaminobacter salicylatoxidans]PWJ79855.1 hypothetical protein C7441_114133 [Pseudaminobacter salicylatoxidans]